MGLQLELLEDRTLLASDFPWLDAAVEADSHYQFEYVWFPSDSQITLKGDNTGNLVINVDFLPNNVKNISASSFADVSLVGTRGVDRLFAADLGNLNVEIPVHKSLITDDVDMLGLFEPAPFTLLEGSDIFIEAGDFTETFLYSDLETLELKINDPESTLWLLSLNPDQTVRANFVPDDFTLIGLENSQLGILGEETEIQIDVDSLLADLRANETQNLALISSDLGFNESVLSQSGSAIENTIIPASESFSLAQPLSVAVSTNTDAIAPERSENLDVANERLSEESLYAYYLENFYNSGAWLPDQFVADDRAPYDEIDFNSISSDLFTSLDMDAGIIIEAPLSEGSGEQGVATVEPTWLEKVELRMNELLARSNNTRLSMGEHLLMRAANEFTPGERPGLIVDTKAPSKNSFSAAVTS